MDPLREAGPAGGDRRDVAPGSCPDATRESLDPRQDETARLETWLLEADLQLIISGYAKYTEVIKTEHLEVIDNVIKVDFGR